MVLSPALFVIVALLVAGQVAARLEALPANAPDTLNRFALYVALPAQILLLVPKLTPKPELAVVALTPWLLLGLSIAMVLAAARVFRFREEVTSALLICVPLGNTSFLGFPMVLALLGEDAMPIAVVYDQLGSFVILSTYALIVVARRGGGENPTFASVVKRVLADDNDGSRHQRFILTLASGRTLLIVHNIDLAPRVEGIQAGDHVAFHGEYEWTEQGGVVHWTHHDPQGHHVAGWLKHDGRVYQ